MLIKRKSGQVQLGESTAVIVIVIIILFFGIIFWNKINSSDIQKINTESQELSVIEIANIVSELPELKCYEVNVNKIKCLDWYKVLAMNATVNSNGPNYEFYNNYFKNSKITIRQIYPTSVNITIYDSKLSNNTKTLLIPIPVNIKNYVNKTTGYGLIIVEGYYKG